jgi:hypothetical protein
MAFAGFLNMEATLFGCWAKITSRGSCLPLASDTGRHELLQLRIAAGGSHSASGNQ